jgi:hypothetical protein
LQYWQAGPPKSLIADSLQVDVKTVLTENVDPLRTVRGGYCVRARRWLVCYR